MESVRGDVGLPVGAHHLVAAVGIGVPGILDHVAQGGPGENGVVGLAVVGGQSPHQGLLPPDSIGARGVADEVAGVEVVPGVSRVPQVPHLEDPLFLVVNDRSVHLQAPPLPGPVGQDEGVLGVGTARMLGEEDPVRLVHQDPVHEELRAVADVEGGFGGQPGGSKEQEDDNQTGEPPAIETNHRHLHRMGAQEVRRELPPRPSGCAAS